MSQKSKKDNIYIKKSTIPNIGNGLFAKKNIKSGTIIIKFTGKLRMPSEKILSSRSNIYFIDEYVLECPLSDLASFANDSIDFTKESRKLMKALKSTEPFYKKYNNTKINLYIKTNSKLHRAYLVATEDINENEEIFCHYGFQHWFKKEITEIGFLQENEIERNGFPEKIFEYPAFTGYVNEFYPTNIRFEIKPFKSMHVVIIYCAKNRHKKQWYLFFIKPILKKTTIIKYYFIIIIFSRNQLCSK